MAEQSKIIRPDRPKHNGFRFRAKLWLAVALIFAAQVGLLFWLGNPPAVKTLHPSPAVVIHFAGSDSSEMLALEDPTLFLLPHYENFSAGWLKLPQLIFEPANWTEASRPLQVRPEQLGTAFASFMETNPSPSFHIEIASESDWPEPPPAQIKPIFSAPSTLRIEGPLAKRRLLTPVHLPPQINTNSEVLPNTEVEVLVNAQGSPLSATILLPSSGSPDADAVALSFAKNARFEPLKAPALGTTPPDRITFGRMIFEWQTLPPASTGKPPSL